MAANYKSIQLKGSRDCDIARWCILVKEQWSGGMSYLIKKALRSYMNQGSFICIGKIHKCTDEKSVLSQQPCISLWLGDSPDIEQWIKLTSNQSIRPATLMREIIRKSITIVPDEEAEWIPSCLDFGTDIFDIANSTRISNSKVASVSATEAAMVEQKKPAPVHETPVLQNAVIQEQAHEVKEVHTFKEHNNTSQKKPPRAAALSGRRFAQH